MTYFMDVVFVVDVSKAMCEYLDAVKQRLLTFLPNFIEALSLVGKNHSDCRAKVITFRNFKNDKGDALSVSPFFYLKAKGIDNEEEISNYRSYIHSLEAYGGDYDKNNSLEALSVAIKNDWSQDCDRRRHYIVLLTATGACPLQDLSSIDLGKSFAFPKSLDELTQLWMSPLNHWTCGHWTRLSQPAKRLIVFAPQVYPWPEIYESWDQVVYNPSKAGEGIDAVSLDDIVNAIVSSC